MVVVWNVPEKVVVAVVVRLVVGVAAAAAGLLPAFLSRDLGAGLASPTPMI